MDLGLDADMVMIKIPLCFNVTLVQSQTILFPLP
jgi:hypothetical protein